MNLKFIFFVIATACMLFSCVPHKKTIYVQNKTQRADSVFALVNHKYLLQVGDNLYVKIMTQDSKTIDLFNFSYSNNTTFQANEMGFHLSGLSIGPDGSITLPVFGQLMVEGKTIDEVKALIQSKVDEYLSDGVANVKLISYKITVLGEVSKPGNFQVSKPDITIFDALGYAGDISDMGDRNNVLLIRKENNKTKVVELDLTDIEVMLNEYFVLYPNDVIYVKPLRAKTLKSTLPTVSLFLSVITTFLLVFSYIQR